MHYSNALPPSRLALISKSAPQLMPFILRRLLSWNSNGNILAVTYSDGAVFLLTYDTNQKVSVRCLVEPGMYNIGYFKPKWSSDSSLLAIHVGRDKEILLLKISNSTRPFLKNTKEWVPPDELAWEPLQNTLAVFLVGTQEIELHYFEDGKEVKRKSVLLSPPKTKLTQYWFNNDIAWVSNTSLLVPYAEQLQIIRFTGTDNETININKGARKIVINNDGTRAIFDQSYSVGDGGWGISWAISLYVNDLHLTSKELFLGFPPDDTVAKSIAFSPFKYRQYAVPPSIAWSADEKRIYFSIISGVRDIDPALALRSIFLMWDANTGTLLHERIRDYSVTDSFVARTIQVLPADVDINIKKRIFSKGENIKLKFLGYSSSFSIIRSNLLPY